MCVWGVYVNGRIWRIDVGNGSAVILLRPANREASTILQSERKIVIDCYLTTTEHDNNIDGGDSEAGPAPQQTHFSFVTKQKKLGIDGQTASTIHPTTNSPHKHTARPRLKA
ncbi:hypothetical protein Ddc_09673 [Ditylenchus destructor]|nr:hypothetical protein Ddc_09673 [Ditylenchus destructor]